MTPAEEAAYVRGQNIMLRRLLSDILRELRANGEEVESAPLVLSQTKAALLELAAEVGAEFREDAHPVEIVKAIGRALDDGDERGDG